MRSRRVVLPKSDVGSQSGRTVPEDCSALIALTMASILVKPFFCALAESTLPHFMASPAQRVLCWPHFGAVEPPTPDRGKGKASD